MLFDERAQPGMMLGIKDDNRKAAGKCFFGHNSFPPSRVTKAISLVGGKSISPGMAKQWAFPLDDRPPLSGIAPKKYVGS